MLAMLAATSHAVPAVPAGRHHKADRGGTLVASGSICEFGPCDKGAVKITKGFDEGDACFDQKEYDHVCASWEGFSCDMSTAAQCGITEEQLDDIISLCPLTCGMCPSKFTNDPVFHYGDDWFKVTMPTHEPVLLLRWNNASTTYELYGEVFEHNDQKKYAQWFDSFQLVTKDLNKTNAEVSRSVAVHRAAAKGQAPSPGFKTMMVELDGEILSRTDKRANTDFQEKHNLNNGVTVSMEKGAKWIGRHKKEEKLAVTAGGLDLEIDSRAAKKYWASTAKQLEFSHLNLMLGSMPKGAEGFLAELSGQQPLSAMTKSYLGPVSNHNTTHHELRLRDVWATWEHKTQRLTAGEAGAFDPPTDGESICPCIAKSSYNYNQPIKYTAYPSAGGMGWLDADLFCKQKGMVLPEPRNSWENAKIVEVAKKSFPVPTDSSHHVWLGSSFKDGFINPGKSIKNRMLTRKVVIDGDGPDYDNDEGSWVWHSECGTNRWFFGDAVTGCERQDGSKCNGPPGMTLPTCAYSNWAFGEPNNWWVAEKEDCLMMWTTSNLYGKAAGSWNDQKCDMPQYVVCASRPSNEEYECVESEEDHHCDVATCTPAVWHTESFLGHTCGAHVEWALKQNLMHDAKPTLQSACIWVGSQPSTAPECAPCANTTQLVSDDALDPEIWRDNGQLPRNREHS